MSWDFYETASEAAKPLVGPAVGAVLGAMLVSLRDRAVPIVIGESFFTTVDADLPQALSDRAKQLMSECLVTRALADPTVRMGNLVQIKATLPAYLRNMEQASQTLPQLIANLKHANTQDEKIAAIETALQLKPATDILLDAVAFTKIDFDRHIRLACEIIKVVPSPPGNGLLIVHFEKRMVLLGSGFVQSPYLLERLEPFKIVIQSADAPSLAKMLESVLDIAQKQCKSIEVLLPEVNRYVEMNTKIMGFVSVGNRGHRPLFLHPKCSIELRAKSGAFHEIPAWIGIPAKDLPDVVQTHAVTGMHVIPSGQVSRLAILANSTSGNIVKSEEIFAAARNGDLTGRVRMRGTGLLGINRTLQTKWFKAELAAL